MVHKKHLVALLSWCLQRSKTTWSVPEEWHQATWGSVLSWCLRTCVGDSLLDNPGAKCAQTDSLGACNLPQGVALEADTLTSHTTRAYSNGSRHTAVAPNEERGWSCKAN